MTTTTEYRIIEGPQPEGSHWASMRPAGEHLQGEIDYMAAALALSRNEATEQDADALDLSWEHLSEGYDGSDEALEQVNGWALEVKSAHWDGSRDLARVVFLLGFGGPNVYLTIDHNNTGHAERITLERYWSGESTAYTLDSRALRVADDFLSLIIPE